MLRFHSRSIAGFGATLVLAVGTVIAATPANAASTANLEVRTKVVSFGDLDLTRPKDVRTLERRIAEAVEHVCEPTSGMTIAERQIYRVCAAEAAADAQEQVKRAVQTALQPRDLTTASR